MTRLQTVGITMATEVMDLPATDKKQISDEAKTLLESVVLKMAIDNVKHRALTDIQMRAPTAETIFYDRFTINGAALVEDELRAYADMEFDEGEEFDKHEVY